MAFRLHLDKDGGCDADTLALAPDLEAVARMGLMVLAAGPSLDARSRAIQGVATGIGFLGAGEILVPRWQPKHALPEVRGLTSAASIWFTAALGVTVAASTPILAGAALLLALITLSARDNADGLPPNDQPEGRHPDQP